MSANYSNIRETGAGWVDLVASNASLNGLSLTVRNEGSSEIQVFFGGASAPTPLDAGNKLAPSEAVNGSGANIWVRGERGFTVAPLEND